MNRFKFQLLATCAMAPDGPSGGGSSGGASGVASSGGGSAPASSAPSSSPSSPGASSSSSTPSGASSSEGGSAAPAASPEASPTPLDADMWAGFDLDSTEDQLASTAEPAPAPAAPKEPAQAQTPQAPEPPAAAQQQEPPPQPQQAQPGPQDVAGQPQQQPQIPTPAEPAKMSQAILAGIEDLATHLSTTGEFALSEAEIEALNTDFASALPKLGAKIYLRAQAAALSQMERVVPAIIQRYMKVDAARQSSQKTFYQRWPQIDQTKHGDLVDRMARTYRAENPQATLAQMVEALGPYVMMAARIDPNSAPQQAAPNGGRAPAAPPTARPAGNGRTPPPSPFVPAVGGAAAQPTAQNADPWGGYGASEEE